MRLTDAKCPICLCIFIKPVTLPCSHELCFNCFSQHINETSAQCPFCRKRIATWARRAAVNNKSIVNEEKWSAIQRAFPQKVKRRLEGVESEEDDDTYVCTAVVSSPGELRKEYLMQRKQIEDNLAISRQKEEEASANLLKQLQKQEEEDRVELERRKRQELDDYLLAQKLAAKRNSDAIKKTKSSTMLDKFLQKPKSVKVKANPSISSACKAKQVEDTPKMVDFIYISDSPVPFSDHQAKSSTQSVGQRKTNHTSAHKAFRSVPDASVASSSKVKPAKSVEKTKLTAWLGKKQFSSNRPLPTCTVSKAPKSAGVSDVSHDSISQELNHFRPVRTFPPTPPKVHEDGSVHKPPLLKCTPRQLSFPSRSPPAERPQSTDVNPVNLDHHLKSPLVGRNVLQLNKERHRRVRRLSKGTSTNDDANKPNGNHSADDVIVVTSRRTAKQPQPIVSRRKSVPRKLIMLDVDSRSEDSVTLLPTPTPVLPRLPSEIEFDDSNHLKLGRTISLEDTSSMTSYSTGVRAPIASYMKDTTNTDASMLTLAQLNDDTRCTSETDKALLATPTSTMHNDDASRGTRQPLLADRDVIICLDDDITMARSDAAKSADLTRFNRNTAAPVLHGNNADSMNACQKQMDIPTFFAGLKKSRRNRHSLDENSNSISACLKPSTTSKTPPPQIKSATVTTATGTCDTSKSDMGFHCVSLSKSAKVSDVKRWLINSNCTQSESETAANVARGNSSDISVEIIENAYAVGASVKEALNQLKTSTTASDKDIQTTQQGDDHVTSSTSKSAKTNDVSRSHRRGNTGENQGPDDSMPLLVTSCYNSSLVVDDAMFGINATEHDDRTCDSTSVSQTSCYNPTLMVGVSDTTLAANVTVDHQDDINTYGLSDDDNGDDKDDDATTLASTAHDLTLTGVGDSTMNGSVLSASIDATSRQKRKRHKQLEDITAEKDLETPAKKRRRSRKDAFLDGAVVTPTRLRRTPARQSADRSGHKTTSLTTSKKREAKEHSDVIFLSERKTRQTVKNTRKIVKPLKTAKRQLFEDSHTHVKATQRKDTPEKRSSVRQEIVERNDRAKLPDVNNISLSICHGEHHVNGVQAPDQQFTSLQAKPKPTKTQATSTKKRRGGGGRRRRKPEVTPPSSNTSIDSFFMSHIPPDERPGRHRKDDVTRTTPRRRCSKATASRSTPPRYHNNNDTAAATDAATSSTKRHRNNTNLDESWRPENATLTSSSRSSTPPNDEDSRQLTVDDFPNKLAYDAYCVEQDELLAKKLQEKFNREAQQHRNVQRHKGGKDEYMLREKRQPAAPKYGSIFTF